MEPLVTASREYGMTRKEYQTFRLWETEAEAKEDAMACGEGATVRPREEWDFRGMYPSAGWIVKIVRLAPETPRIPERNWANITEAVLRKWDRD